jgi:hypothetical protein
MKTKNTVAQLALDHYQGKVTQFSKDEAEHTLRCAFNEILDLGSHKNFRRAMKHNGRAMFDVMEDVLDTLITEGLENQFEGFVDYKTVAVGDKPAFMVDDYHLFNVATLAAGTNNIRRQKLDRSAFYVPTEYKGVKIYAEFEEYLAGKVDFAKMIAKVQRSMNAQMAADVNTAITAGYSALSAPYAYNGVWDLTQFNTLIQHVEAATGVKAMVMGSRTALQKAAPSLVAYNGSVIESRNDLGFYKVIDGTTMFEIKQSHIPGTDTFAVGTDYLLVVPQGEEKIVKGVLEGDAIIEETTNGLNGNQDQSMEYLFEKKYGFGVVTSTKYGVYTFSS